MQLLQTLRPADALDILLCSFLIYRGLLIIRGTKAIQVLVGLTALIGLYLLSKLLGLTALNWILDEFSLYLVLAVIVLFQDDIRRGLARVGDPLFGRAVRTDRISVYQQIARACFRLADQGKGALIAVERSASLEDLADEATAIDAVLSEELLVAIFQPTSPVHDGAVVIRKGRIWIAGGFLPLTTRPDIDRYLGTRHRAALGQTEQTDSLIFVVSEERRAVSIAFRGELHPVMTPDELRLEVQRLLQMEAAEADSAGITQSNPTLSGSQVRVTGSHPRARSVTTTTSSIPAVNPPDETGA